jgi:RHS repeat-associated protein
LPDGGKIEFLASQRHEPELINQYWFTFQAQAIIDPYGLRTTLSYYADGSLNTVRQDQGGRQLQLFYVNGVIDHVQASDGRVVQYNYGQTSFSPGAPLYTYLDNIVYPFEPALNLSPTAHYTYQAPNGPNPNGHPLLSSCDDPMYPGPMKKISYAYATSNADSSNVAVGQILSEKNTNTGQIVSRLYIANTTTHSETRGDGPFRVFVYEGAFLKRFSDFKNQFSSILYENGYVSRFTDARSHITRYQREGPNGMLNLLTHPDPEQSTQTFAYKYVNGAPCFLEIRGDERLVNGVNSNTFFVRDPVTSHVTKIWYPDYPSGPTEEFTYNTFGQVETHTMTSGGVENFRYDARGLMYESWPPATPSDLNPYDHRTRYFYYTSGPQMDRLWYVIDPRNNTTTFEYNTRGQITKVTYPGGSYTQNGYNADGTLAWTADENHPNASWNANERTRYGYDDYKRVISVTNPLNKTFNLSYAPPNGAGSYSHTMPSVYRATSPLNKITTFDYDENFRRKMVRKGLESVDDDGGTWFGYDEVGNLTSVQDPRGHITTFGYDERNRRISATNPAPFNNEITRWEYDTRSNLKKEKRPDLSFRTMEYDALSRVIDTYGFANEHIHYERDLAGNAFQMTDPKLATYFFGYDKMNRKISASYPADAAGGQSRSEGWLFDVAGNLYQYTNPAGQVRTHNYDSRNRPWDSSWDSGGGPLTSTRFDNASRLTSVMTNKGETIVSFGYDDANRQIWDEQTVAGFPTYRVETPRDDDGFRASLNPAGVYTLSYDYTKRGQLANIYLGGVPRLTHSYDLAGNMIKRQDVYQGVNDSTNIMDGAGVSQYDALNRPMLWEQTANVNGVGNRGFAWSHFKYDNLGRLTASWRDEQAGKGEWFGYNATGELTGVSYNADGVSTGPPQNASRTVAYIIAPNTLNRESMTDNGDPTAYTPNALNQYENVGGGNVYYDGNFNLIWTGSLSAWYDSANRLMSVTSGENYAEFTYDGLGRCLKRTVDWETTIIVYDGWRPTVEWSEWDGLKAWNIYGAGADEILYRHDAYLGDLRYHLDRMGNVAFLLDSDGDGIERYTYDAFGRPTVTEWNGQNPRTYSWYGNRFMFTGREYFAGLGIYDYRTRFYHPILGRFLQNDPIRFDGGDANLFRYCGGDPVNRRDPFGLLTAETERITVIGTFPGGYPGNFGNTDFNINSGAFDNNHAAGPDERSYSNPENPINIIPPLILRPEEPAEAVTNRIIVTASELPPPQNIGPFAPDLSKFFSSGDPSALEDVPNDVLKKALDNASRAVKHHTNRNDPQKYIDRQRQRADDLSRELERRGAIPSAGSATLLQFLNLFIRFPFFILDPSLTETQEFPPDT